MKKAVFNFVYLFFFSSCKIQSLLKYDYFVILFTTVRGHFRDFVISYIILLICHIYVLTNSMLIILLIRI